MTTTLRQLKEAIGNVYLLADEYIVDVLIATVISNRLTISDRPVWLLILGPSSGGKTLILQLIDDLGSWIVPVDTLTTNTFASGFRSVEESSLLNKANGGILVFKDFTALTSMNEDGLREIMGQLRAIYDGSFDKKTGAGKDIPWKGKVGIIAAGTIAVQRKLRQYSEQGERFINYIIKQPGRIEMTKRAIRNQKYIKEREVKLREMTCEFVQGVMERAEEISPEITEEVQDKMIMVADFCTLARSPVITNKKTGKVEWVPDPEMPARMATMLSNIIVTLGLMNEDGKITTENQKAVYKIALDSIPADRRLVMRYLTLYGSASTKALAVKLDYPTDTVLTWLRQLNALKLVQRVGHSGPSDLWELGANYRELVAEFEGIIIGDNQLNITEDEEEAFLEGGAGEGKDETDESLFDQVDWGDFK